MELGNIFDEITCWVKFGEDGEVLLRYVPADELTKILKKSTRREFQRGRVLEETDTVEFNRLLGRASVRDWKNLTVRGEPFPYSPENCDILMTKSYEFAQFVNEHCIEIANFIEQVHEETKKKSGNLQNGG